MSEHPLEQSLLDHARPHFRLQHPLRPAPALVCICGMEDEKYQQIDHLEPQSTFDSLIPMSCRQPAVQLKLTLWFPTSSTDSIA